MAELTVIGLVDFALDQAGLDISYRTKGRNWLNYIVNKLSKNNNYKFYNVTAPDVTFLAGQTIYPLPTDFLTTDTIYRVQNQNGALVQGDQIFVLDSYRFDQYSRGLNGDPTLAMVDTENQTIIFNNIPGSTTQTSFRLRYFRKPANYAVDGSDDTDIPDFPSQDTLIEELMKLAYENLDDQRYESKKQDAAKAQRDLQRNETQNIDTNVVDLSHAKFVNRWRR